MPYITLTPTAQQEENWIITALLSGCGWNRFRVVATTILNKQLWISNKMFSTLVTEWGQNTPACYEMLCRSSD
jgi:hypothetical protein